MATQEVDGPPPERRAVRFRDLRQKLSPWRRRTEATDAFVDRTMREYLALHPEDDHAQRSYPLDRVRFARSLEWLARLGLDAGGNVLELGAYGIASHVIAARFPRVQYTRTEFDLRDRFPYPEGAFDVVVSMEVLEHVGDLSYAHATVLSGYKHCLAETHRVLRAGGRMFLTTPNACSYLVLERALRQEPPWVYPWHFRELTVRELAILSEEAGLHVVELRTEDVWAVQPAADVVSLVRAGGYPTDDRGDDIFLVAEKRPEKPVPRGMLDMPG
jgi:2-polyprenyl-3-methyl-5-hydroxy-6-metoxy-1,4-benzoquinol methylase